MRRFQPAPGPRAWPDLTPALALLTACAGPAPADTGPPEREPATLPGDGPQHHATLACGPHGCLVARQVGASVRFSLLDDDGAALTQTGPDHLEPTGWNHPEVVATEAGFAAVLATRGAPAHLTLDPDGEAVSGVQLAEPRPKALWPAVDRASDGRFHAFWSDKITPSWVVYDPAEPIPQVQTFDLELDQATVDPPAVVAVPGGWVRVWTAKNGFVWQVRLQRTDADGGPLAEPVIAAEGEGLSRGTRPQVAADATGAIAVSWRLWPSRDAPPEGAFVRVFDPELAPMGPALRLDADRGDRPMVAALPDGWWVAWEEGSPSAVFARDLAPDGTPRTEPEPLSATELPAGRVDLVVAPDRRYASWEEVRDARVDVILDADVRVLRLLP